MQIKLPLRAKQFANLLSALAALCICLTAQADDIDVYTAGIAAQKKPNILLVLDYSGSMANDINGRNPRTTGQPAKIDILKNAVSQVLDSNSNQINAGLGSLYSNTTTGIQWPVSDLSADAHTVDPKIPKNEFTVSDIIKKQLDKKKPGGPTATVDALVEAAQYFRGGKVTHNDTSRNPTRRHKPDTWSSVSNRYSGGHKNAAVTSSYSPSDAYSQDAFATYYCNDYSQSGGPDYCENKRTYGCSIKTTGDNLTPGFNRLSNLWGNYTRCEYKRESNWEGARYNSPINQSCQANAIILVSDGEPSRVKNGKSLHSITNAASDSCEDLSQSVFNRASGKSTMGNCGVEVLQALSSSNQHSDITNSQVKTYTIGLSTKGAARRYLDTLATAGDGKFFQANSAQQLSAALEKSIQDIRGGSESLTHASIDVDKSNFSHDSRVFFSLFSPTAGSAWNGNLKSYNFTGDGLADDNGDTARRSRSNPEQNSDTSQSFWSAKSDGNTRHADGVSSQLSADSRKLYTFTEAVIPPNGISLSASKHYALDKSNSKITNTLLGINHSSATKDELLDWIQQAPMGDPLHTRSVTINYGDKQVAFISTNQGLMHAFDASDSFDKKDQGAFGGNELYAFMPRRLLSNLARLKANSEDSGHVYGLDGSITRWHEDDNNDGIVNQDEQVLLIFGMRRGGYAYYALDVSQWNSPRLAWMIDNKHPDFASMAQTWSRMSLIQVNNNGNTEKVLAFSAGYDADAQDSINAAVVSHGNAIYMINRNGKRVWKADRSNHDAMKYSIASDLTVIDSDGDSIADRLYVGDVGGQLWRVEFPSIDTDPSVILMAELNDTNHQPFFYPPSVAMNRTSQGEYLSIAIGSGNRTNPLLSDVQNHLYMIRDNDVRNRVSSASYDSITPDELYDVTDNSVESDDPVKAAAARTSLQQARGWRLRLTANEKALSKVVAFEGKLLASTFKAEVPTEPHQCGYEMSGKYYAMSLVDARPMPAVSQANTSATYLSSASSSRSKLLQGNGIPSSPVIIFPKGSSTVRIMVDRETVDSIEQRISRVSWNAR